MATLKLDNENWFLSTPVETGGGAARPEVLVKLIGPSPSLPANNMTQTPSILSSYEEDIVLDQEASLAFVSALRSAPDPTPDLIRLFARRR